MDEIAETVEQTYTEDEIYDALREAVGDLEVMRDIYEGDDDEASVETVERSMAVIEHVLKQKRASGGEQAIEAMGLRVSLVEGHDGYPVVYVESGDETIKQTEDGIPEVRVYVNDCCVSNDTPYRNGETGQW